MDNKILIDLFSGAGGLSYGFRMAGFNINLAIEYKKSFIKSYKYNNPECVCLNEDIIKLDCEKISNEYIKNKEVEGIIGGPPCQGFSSVGYRKIDDPRNMLIFFFIKWVGYFKPIFYVMENVPGILTMAKGQIVEKIKKMYKNIGYTCYIRTLVSANYGIPQLRKRIFFIGTKDGKLKSLKIPKTNRENIEQRTLFNTKKENRYLTVMDAISDILAIEPFKGGNNELLYREYNVPPKTEYEKYLRKDSDKLYEHIVPNHSKLVVERISRVKQGKDHSSLPPEYQLKKGYPNIYGRLHLKRPADTITGNYGCVSSPGKFIHPTQNRALSVREGARLQSFPDNYRFFGSMTDKYKQVGNAVPPLLAFAVASAIKTSLKIKTFK